MAVSTHFKLGLFTLVALAAGLVAAFALGARSIREETVRYYMYFDESVQGLDIGAPVKYRGVSIGSIDQIGIAPDGRHVEVVAAVEVSTLVRLGLADPRSERPQQLPANEDLRAQLGSQGITGVKFVNIDFFDPYAYPEPLLPFETPENTFPVATSFFKNLEDGVSGVVALMPDATNTALATLQGLETMVGDFRKQQVPERVAKTLDNVDEAVTALRTIIKQVEGQKIPAQVTVVLEGMVKALGKVDGVLTRVDGDEGLVASTKRTVDAFGDFGENAVGTGGELDRALRDVGEAAQAVRDLADSLERDPDMLLKGKSKGEKP